VGEDGPERPSDSDGSGEITLRRGEGVCCCGALEEEKSKEDKDLGPDSSGINARVDTKSLKGCQDDEDGRPPVVEGEGEVDEEFIAP